MGIGIASGENRAQAAAHAAVSSPLLEISINGAKGVLFAIAGGEDLGMVEVHEAAKIITESVDPNAKIIFGAIKDDKLKKNEIRVTVIATGFPATGINPRGTGLFNLAREKDEAYPLSARSTTLLLSRSKSLSPHQNQRSTIKDEDDWGAVPSFLRRPKIK
jgi:cell division protein FtsZ